MLKLDSIQAGYGHHVVLDDFSISISPNQLCMILGPNGSGKSTLLNVMGGWLPPKKGRVILQDRDLSTLSVSQKAKYTGRIATSLDHVTLPLERFALLGAYHKHGWWQKYSQEDHQSVQKALDQMHLKPWAKKPMDQLSTGQKQRAAFAQVLVQNPLGFFLDEPSSALDPYSRFELMEHLLALRAPERFVVAIVHDIDLALRYADFILVLDHGHLVFQGTPFELINQDILAHVFSLQLRDWDPITRTGKLFPLDLDNHPLP